MRCALQERARLLRSARHVHSPRVGRRRVLVPFPHSLPPDAVHALFERSATIAQAPESCYVSMLLEAGLEPAISSLRGRRLIH